ncbi:MAG: hypothetical protein MJ181_10820 [Treponema sp.]|nr:hypothetical protein [Treponema sp.]
MKKYIFILLSLLSFTLFSCGNEIKVDIIEEVSLKEINLELLNCIKYDGEKETVYSVGTTTDYDGTIKKDFSIRQYAEKGNYNSMVSEKVTEHPIVEEVTKSGSQIVSLKIDGTKYILKR